MTIDLQNRQNLPSPSRIFASILQVRQAARMSVYNLIQTILKIISNNLNASSHIHSKISKSDILTKSKVDLFSINIFVVGLAHHFLQHY